MANDTKPADRLPGLVASMRRAFERKVVGPDKNAQPSEPPSNDSVVRTHWRSILARYMAGEAMEDIGKDLKPIAVSGSEIRRVFREDPELKHRMAQARLELSHHLFDSAVRAATKAERSGEYGVAIGGYMKLAATLNKGDYSQRVVLEGNPEAPIPVQHGGEVRHTMSPDEAYRKLMEGGS